MRHKHFSNSFKRSRTDQHDSNNTPVEQSYTPAGPLQERAVAPGNGPVDHISRNTSLTPASPAGHVHYSNYNIPRTHDAEAGPSNGTTGVGKRKRADISGLCAGSSSSSSQMPAVSYYPSVPPYRNVRRRSTLELEPSHTSRCYHSTTHPANCSAPLQPAGLDATSGQWNSGSRYAASSNRRMSPPDFNGSNQFHAGGSSGGSVFSRHGVSSSQYLHARSMTRRIPSSYENDPSHTHHAHGGTSRWRGSYRSGRPRITVERSRSVIDRTEAHAQTIMMVDRASFYGNSRNFTDEYRDWRLDIDNMSYEELLNLEERMGNVSTGLSEDCMSKCLTEKVYSSSRQDHMEVSCPICLEEYQNDDKVGMVEKCGHDYHVDCIKRWLLMKKVCPVCKSECSNQQPTQG